jgi:pimeloyl-ACP methyl ester carboxylesterase
VSRVRSLRRLNDLAMPLGLRAAAPLTSTATGSAALRAGILYEAFLRARQREYLQVVSTVTGWRTEQQRRERAERAERERLAPGRPSHGNGVPAVFWHGTDRARGDRPLVVLVNGWTASGLLWPKSLIEELSERCDVVRVDNRGSGYSRTAPAPFTIARMADDVVAVLRAIGAPAATVVVGLSMGGMIAQELAIRHPGSVERLVLCGTRPPAPAGFFPAGAVLESMLSEPRPGESRREFFERSWSAVVEPRFLQRDPAAMREIVDLTSARPTPRVAVMHQLRAISSWYGSDRLVRITAPTTVIHGRDDPLVPVGNGMRIAQLIPGARYVELSGVGHIVPFEAPDVLAAEILAGRSARR